MLFKKKKYIAIFVLKEQKSYTIKKRKKFDPIKTDISYKGKTWTDINIDIPTYTNGLKLLFFFDLNGEQLFIETFTYQDELTPEIRDLLFGKKIIAQFISGLIDTFKLKNIWNIILYMFLGGLVGFIIGGFVA